MKLLLVIIAMGVIGIIGTIEYTHAHNTPTVERHIHKQINFDTYYDTKHAHVILDRTICNQNTTINTNTHGNSYDTNVFVHNYFNESIKFRVTLHFESYYKEPPYIDEFILTPEPNFIWYLPSHTDVKYFQIDMMHPCNVKNAIHVPMFTSRYDTTPITPTHFNNNSKSQINELESKLDKQKQKVNDKIERKNNWKERYNTCFDKKESFKIELNNTRTELNQCKLDIVDNENQCTQLLNDHETQIITLESNYNLLQQNLTDAEFTIEKLKQEKVDLIKKVETLETQLQEN